MTNTHIRNGRVILGGRVVNGATIAISGGRITSVGGKIKPVKGSSAIDARGYFVAPGFIDCHIHGEPEKIFLNEARHGTTAFVIAESCAPLNHIYRRAEGIKEFIRTHPFGPNVLGLRLEGPYISMARAGAQNVSCIRKPTAKELSEMLKKIEKIGTGAIFPGANSRKMEPAPILKIMTIAPELKDIKPLIKLLREHKIIASIGHSDATYESAIEGIDAGITHSTHTFNAMSGIDRREPGVVGAVLMDDRVMAEIILDLIHVHKALFGLLLKLKKIDNAIIVTDSLTSGKPEIGTGAIFQGANSKKMEPAPIFTGGVYRLEDGRLAGSSLTMIQALKNAVGSCGLPLLDALKLITLNPARLLGVEQHKGAIGPGKDADIVIFDKEFDVKMTMIRGRIAYRRHGF